MGEIHNYWRRVVAWVINGNEIIMLSVKSQLYLHHVIDVHCGCLLHTFPIFWYTSNNHCHWIGANIKHKLQIRSVRCCCCWFFLSSEWTNDFRIFEMRLDQVGLNVGILLSMRNPAHLRKMHFQQFIYQMPLNWLDFNLS